MSYGMMPFAVKLARVERTFGSRDAAPAAEITAKFHPLLREALGDDEDDLSQEQALFDIIEGHPLREEYGYRYAYVLEMLCWHFGRFLPNGNFCPMGMGRAQHVDRVLTEAGVPSDQFRFVDHLMFRGSPIAIPHPEEFPCIGYIKAKEVGPTLRAVQSVNVSSFDPEMRETLTELRGWLEVCAKSVCDLVCFYH
jgi:hypothetical protein